MKKRIKSFRYAFMGIYTCISQPNMIIHLIVAVLVILAGLFFRISHIEWLFITISVSSVLTAEVFNTSIEKLTDIVSPQINENAGKVKDIAAGAVLITATGAVVAGIIIFLPKIILLFSSLKH